MIGMIDLLKKILSTDTENEVLEFKKAHNQIDKDKLGRYFTALSNEANLKNERSAYIILGVDNSKNILGTNISDKQLNEYKLEIANHTSPTLNFIRAERIETEKAKYIKQRGFKDDHYKSMILQFIAKYGKANKNDIENLIIDILPSVLNEKQKSNKVRNIVYAMTRKDKTIINQGTKRYAEWVLSLSKNETEK